MTLDCENVVREQEALRQLNDQLQAQIVALQGTQAQPVDEPIVREMHNDGPIMYLRWPRPISPLYEDNLDNEADLPRY